MRCYTNPEYLKEFRNPFTIIVQDTKFHINRLNSLWNVYFCTFYISLVSSILSLDVFITNYT